jgi:hypothetical protein
MPYPSVAQHGPQNVGYLDEMKHGRVQLVMIALASTVFLGAKKACAQTPTSAPPLATGSDQNEWSKGVSNENKDKARGLLTAGNLAFANDRFKEALDKYQEALKLWDHPAIAFNAVKSLVQLDMSVEAFDMLERSLRFAEAPLGSDIYKEALNYKRLLSNLVAAVEVKCTQNIVLTVDGSSVPCPGKQSFRVKPGRHVIAGSANGYVTLNKIVTLISGSNDTVDVSLVTVAAGIETKTRFATWQPWAVVGAGAVVLGAGVGLKFSASSLNNDYAAAARDKCALACTTEELTTGTLGTLDSSWRRRDKIAIATLAVGGVTLVGGAIFLLLNRPYSVEKKRDGALSFIPQLGRDVRGLVVSGQF